MAAQGLFWLFIIYLTESDGFHSAVRRIINAMTRRKDAEMMAVDDGVPAAAVEDSDVAAERQRIIGTPLEQLATTDAVVLRQLTKFYGSLLAVDRLSVGIPKGE